MLTRVLIAVIGLVVFTGIGGLAIGIALTRELPSMEKWRNAKA